MDIDVTTLRGRRAVHRFERTSVGDIFERLTWSYPDQVAIAGWEGAYGDAAFARVTYRQADETANRLAHALAAAGLAPGDRVLLFCENSVEAFLAKVGIAKAGMVAVPLNPNLATDVLAHLIELTEPGFAIVDAELWPRAQAAFDATGLAVGATITIGGGPVGSSPSFAALIAEEAATEPDVEIHGDDIWELLFTSGTTSLPKGAMISHTSTHMAALNFTVSLTRGLRHECDLRLAVFLPIIYHIGDQIFPFATFLAGGSVLIGRRPVPGPVAEALAAERTTTLWAGSPQFVNALAAELDARPELDVSALQVLVYGWGALSPAVLENLEKHCGELVTLGIFGQTEAIACHRFWPTKWPEVHRATAPAVNYVGVPSPLLASDVVDETGEPVRGEPGEAVYRSPAVTAGYYRNPEATAEAFRGGWFHSGDSAQVDGDGLRIMVDRYKDIVKTGGENVSSMRVETVLMSHPDVLRAAVIGLPHERWGEAVTAVVVPQPGATPDEADVIAFCKERLAGFETPKAVVVADALPETVGGKILKYKLREAHARHYGGPLMGKKRIPKDLYEAELLRLQGELVQMQEWIKSSGTRLVVVFEGRDAAGKGGTIQRVSAHLNPRICRIVALPAPSTRERTQWYFQRYIEHLPAAGEIVLLDRSWYNRAGVERVMGFCTPTEYSRFMRQCPIFENLLVEDGILLRKYWFSVSDGEQERRFRERMGNPLKQWKLSPMDLESITRWDDYSQAKDEMLVHTDTDISPWFVVEAEDKRRARLNMIHHLLSSVPWEASAPKDLEMPKRPKGRGYKRPPREIANTVADHAQSLLT